MSDYIASWKQVEVSISIPNDLYEVACAQSYFAHHQSIVVSYFLVSSIFTTICFFFFYNTSSSTHFFHVSIYGE